MCPQKNPPAHMVDSSEHATSAGQVESEELFIGTLTGPRSAENSAWFSKLPVGGITVKFKLDTGAEANVLALSVYSKLKNKSSLPETSVVLSSYGEFKVKPVGKLNLSCKVQEMEQTLRFFLVAVESPPILGLSACQKLNFVRRVETLAQSPLTKSEIIKEFSDVFSGLGRMEGEYHIELDDKVEPVIHPSRRVPYSLLEKLKLKVQELEEEHVN